jgi:hypothetical protein
MAVPNIFGSATSAIPLSQLDQNFATAITLGNTAVYLGNTTTSLGNVTLTNVTISSGNVSVSTATVGAGSNTAPSITTTGDTNTGIFFPAADTIAFAEGGAEAMRIDSSGNVGIGVTPSVASVKLTTVGGPVQLSPGTTSQEGIRLTRASGICQINGINNDNNAYNALTFATGASEAMRIDTSGNLLVGTTANAITAYSASKSLVQSADYSGSVAQLINSTSTTGTQYFLAFGRGASVCGQITSGSTNSTSFTTSSDYRLKKDVQPITGALAKVQTLKPCTYKWVEDNTISEGFIAHELAETFPQAVVGEKDAVNAEGNPVYQGVDTSFLVATLTAAIQELKALTDTQASTITALTARIEALENK